MPAQDPIAIAELDDPRLAAYRDLSTRERGTNDVVVEGMICIERAWAGSFTFEHLLATAEAVDNLPKSLVAAQPVYVLSAKQLREVAGYRFHRGVMGILRRHHLVSRFDTWWEETLTTADSPIRLLMAERVTDPVNVGGLIRTARAFGLAGIVLGTGCGDPWSRRAIRAGMGHCFALPCMVDQDLGHRVADLRRAFGGVKALALTTSHRAVCLPERRLDGSWALVVGNEGHGLPATLVERCDMELTIPMAQGVDSLNVVVATGVALWALQGAGATGP